MCSHLTCKITRYQLRVFCPERDCTIAKILTQVGQVLLALHHAATWSWWMYRMTMPCRKQVSQKDNKTTHACGGNRICPLWESKKFFQQAGSGSTYFVTKTFVWSTSVWFSSHYTVWSSCQRNVCAAVAFLELAVGQEWGLILRVLGGRECDWCSITCLLTSVHYSSVGVR
jgi:hypothetical protein